VQSGRATNRRVGLHAARRSAVRIVDFLGPVSPELVLVDPELAPRARAVLPELSGARGGGPPPVRSVPTRPPSATALRPRRLGGTFPIAVAAVGTAALLAVVGHAVRRPGHLTPPSALPGSPRLPLRHPEGPVAPGPLSAERVPPPRFAWAPAAGSSAYRLALYRDRLPIFERDIRATAFQMPGTWTYRGEFHAFTKGAYRWVVWPLVGEGAAATPRPAIVSSTYDA
jgi:hypothetical protein